MTEINGIPVIGLVIWDLRSGQAYLELVKLIDGKPELWRRWEIRSHGQEAVPC